MRASRDERRREREVPDPEDAVRVARELYHLAPPPFLDHISRSAKLPITWEDASGEELDDWGDERPALSLLAVTSGEEDAVEQRLLARLGYAPSDDEQEDLKRHGVSVVHRWPARAKRALEELAYPRIVAQQPAQPAASDCAQGGTVKRAATRRATCSTGC